LLRCSDARFGSRAGGAVPTWDRAKSRNALEPDTNPRHALTGTRCQLLPSADRSTTGNYLHCTFADDFEWRPEHWIGISSTRRCARSAVSTCCKRVHEDVFDRSIDVQILRLRRKLEPDPSAPRVIQTERCVGYVFALQVERTSSGETSIISHRTMRRCRSSRDPPNVLRHGRFNCGDAMLIRPATQEDSDAIWEILEPTIIAGETYALPRDMRKADALAYWTGPGRETFVAEEAGRIVGTYYLRTNQPGGGAHVANCGYMTASHARGRGVAGSMCKHSLQYARERGFRAMQFNFVIGTNEGAIRLWRSLGFEIAGCLPMAFLHPRHGYTDALVMFQAL
jgi:L-amino acid N-acyltransferase YncA